MNMAQMEVLERQALYMAARDPDTDAEGWLNAALDAERHGWTEGVEDFLNQAVLAERELREYHRAQVRGALEMGA